MDLQRETAASNLVQAAESVRGRLVVRELIIAKWKKDGLSLLSFIYFYFLQEDVSFL